jgi:hypothetical protein
MQVALGFMQTDLKVSPMADKVKLTMMDKNAARASVLSLRTALPDADGIIVWCDAFLIALDGARKPKLSEKEILETVAVTGSVPPKTFVGSGFVVNGLVRRGLLDWERANPSRSAATALIITPAGRALLSSGKTGE